MDSSGERRFVVGEEGTSVSEWCFSPDSVRAAVSVRVPCDNPAVRTHTGINRAMGGLFVPSLVPRDHRIRTVGNQPVLVFHLAAPLSADSGLPPLPENAELVAGADGRILRQAVVVDLLSESGIICTVKPESTLCPNDDDIPVAYDGGTECRIAEADVRLRWGVDWSFPTPPDHLFSEARHIRLLMQDVSVLADPDLCQALVGAALVLSDPFVQEPSTLRCRVYRHDDMFDFRYHWEWRLRSLDTSERKDHDPTEPDGGARTSVEDLRESAETGADRGRRA